MTPASPRPVAAPLALATALALAACGAGEETRAPLQEEPEEEIIGSEPVPDHEPGQSPPAINDPTSEGPPLINRTGPDTEAEIDIGAD